MGCHGLISVVIFKVLMFSPTWGIFFQFDYKFADRLKPPSNLMHCVCVCLLARVTSYYLPYLLDD